MSETSETKTKTLALRVSLFIVLAVFFLLVLVYAGGYFILPGMVRWAFQEENCETVLSMDGVYSSLYPFVTVKSIGSQVMECAVYTLAITHEGSESWQDSYNAFRIYLEAYPNGLFSAESHEHTSIVLGQLAKEAADQRQYDRALAHLDLVLTDYGDTDAAASAQNQKADIYLAWAAGLRTEGDFVGTERIFHEFLTWSENSNNTENIKAAQRGLAQTYLDWGLALQSEKHFEDARMKYELAVKTDPDPSSSDGPAAQAKAGWPVLFIQWGDYLIDQKDFTGGIEHYEIAAALSESKDDSKDIIAKGYVRWSVGITVEEDFIGALILLDFAQENAATDAMKKTVEDARSDLYLAFSKSNGKQAQEAIKDAVRIVCQHHASPSLPIFGLDGDAVLAGMDGVADKLPENVEATTPGSLHYVACIEEDSKVVGSSTHNISSSAFGDTCPCFSVAVQYTRIQYFWNVTLREVETARDVNTTSIEGGEPPPLPTDPAGIVGGAKKPRYEGPKPDVDDLADWLLTVIK